MEINATTYETIFLLYIDNELSPKERLQVEAWIVENPSYALLMEELKGTLMLPESIRFPNKANLKKRPFAPTKENIDTTEIENLDAIWTATYSNYLMQDMQAIPGLSTEFKNGLKKNTANKGILIHPFGFNQNKFTYATVAALLMLFIGYQQLTKTPELTTVAANIPIKKDKVLLQETIPNQTNNTLTNNEIASQTLVQQSTNSSLYKANGTDNVLMTNSNYIVKPYLETKETIAIVEPMELYVPATNTNTIPENTTSALATTLTSAIDAEAELATDATAPVIYEIIDTEDPDRTIYIANIEIDGNKLRGLKRKVSSLFKNNKSERNK
jgi:hypothetical protein